MSLKSLTLLSLLMFFLGLSTVAYGQLPPIGICGTMEEGETGDQVCVHFTAENFTSVSSFQFGLAFNSTLIRPICPIQYINPILSDAGSGGLVVGCVNADRGQIRLIFDDGTGNSVTVPDGDTLFTICFNIIGEVGLESIIDISDYNIFVEVVQKGPDGVDINRDVVNFKPGVVRIISNNFQIVAGHCDTDGSLGSLWFYGVGGTPPYNYTVNPGGFTGILNNDAERANLGGLSPALYTIQLTDATGAIITATRRVNNDTPFSILRDTVINPNCYYTETGEIRILELEGGSGSFTYEWSNLISYVDTLQRLRAGTYTVTITDNATKCQIEETYNLVVDTIRFSVMLQDTATCATSRNGSVLITNITGGMPYETGLPYSARINSGATFRRIDVPHMSQNNLGIGNVRVEIQDAAGCTVDTVLQMPYLYDVAIDTVLFQDISCHGANDGNIRIRAFVDNPNIRFGYTPSANILNSGNLGGTFIAQDLPPADYSILARDLNTGCQINYQFTITEPDPLVINPSITQPDCVDLGRIEVNPTGGTAPYTFTWSPDQGNANLIENISGGTFNLTVTDANNCTEETSIVMNTAGTLNITIETIAVSCEGRTDGRATVSVQFSGGNIQPFTVFWRDENGNRIQGNTTEIGNLAAGNYTVEVIAADGCSSQPRDFSVGAGVSIDFTSTVDPIRCFGDQGLITVNINGDPTGYRYEWREVGNVTPLATTNTFAPRAGQYTVTVISPDGCERTESFTITQPDRLDDIIVDFRTIECFGRQSGAAIINNLVSEMTYFWSNNTTGPNLIAVPAGAYWVVGTLDGCRTDTAFFTITQFPKLEIDSSRLLIVNPTCFGDDNGSISLEATGGTRQQYRYRWSNGATTNSISNLTAGTYTVTLSDSNNCEEEYQIVLTQPSELIASLDNNRSQFLDCNNRDNARLAVTTTGGNPGIKTVTWQDGVTSDNGVAMGLSPGTYCATITDNFGCRDTFCYELTAPEPLEGEMNIPEDPACFGGTTCLSVASISGGTGNRYTFQINNGQRYPIDSCVTVFAGTYIINLIDSSGCSITTSVTVNQPEPIIVSLADGPTINLGEPSAVITGSVFIPSGNDFTTSWSPGEVDCINIDCTSVNVSPSETTTYTLVVTDTNGCRGSSQTTVTVKKTRNVFFANIFTPNQDGINDFFQPVIGIGVESVVSFVIYDRWGNMVFERSNYQPDPAGPGGWDGSFNGRKLDPGVFVYVCKVRFVDNREIDYSGSVTMLGSNR